MDWITERYTDLQAAIILQAIDDYKNALRGNDRKSEKTIKECERFFLNRWGQTLSLNHGENIIKRCKKEVAEEQKKQEVI